MAIAASVVVSLMQIVTSIQDATFSAAPGRRSGRRGSCHAVDAAESHGAVGQSAAILDVVRTIELLAGRRRTVPIMGQTGTV